jgi:hypothetical protein
MSINSEALSATEPQSISGAPASANASTNGNHT